MSWGSVNYKQLEALQKKLEALQEKRDAFIERCSKELAARLLRKVVLRTPVGVYDRHVHFVTHDGQEVDFDTSYKKTGGTLRRGWVPPAQADSLVVRKVGSDFIIDIVNPVEYASYVEYGHRTPSGGWVEGRFMLTLSVQEIQQIAPKLLEKRVAEWLGGVV